MPKGAPLLVHALARAQVSGKALKMAAYGALVSAPLAHALVSALQRAFAGRAGLTARVGMLLASQLVVAPVQIFSKSALLLFHALAARSRAGVLEARAAERR